MISMPTPDVVYTSEEMAPLVDVVLKGCRAMVFLFVWFQNDDKVLDS